MNQCDTLEERLVIDQTTVRACLDAVDHHFGAWTTVRACLDAVDHDFGEDNGYDDPHVAALRVFTAYLIRLASTGVVFMYSPPKSEGVNNSVLKIAKMEVREPDRWHDSWCRLFKKDLVFRDGHDAKNVDHAVLRCLKSLGMVQDNAQVHALLLVLCMGAHPRLGARSPLLPLPEDLLLEVCARLAPWQLFVATTV
jgi:hypothetical protein